MTFSDFKEGLALFCKQGEIARRRIIFQIFDTNSRDSITREEFRLIHSHFPPTILIAMISGCIETDGTNVRNWLAHNIKLDTLEPDQSKSGIHILEQVAFPNGQDTINFDEFNLYMERIPQLLIFFEKSFPYDIQAFDMECDKSYSSILETNYNFINNKSTINVSSKTSNSSVSPYSTQKSLNRTNSTMNYASSIGTSTKSYVKLIQDESLTMRGSDNENGGNETPSYLKTWNRYAKAFWCLNCTYCQSQIRYCYHCGGNLYPIYDDKEQTPNSATSEKKELQCTKCHRIVDPSHCPICGHRYHDNKVNVQLDSNEGDLQSSTQSGYIYTLSTFNKIHKHLIVIYNRFLYYYEGVTSNHITDTIYPLLNCHVEITHNEFMEKQEYYGFSIQFPGFSNPVVFYVPSTQERTTWMSIIEKMSKVRSFEEEYHMLSKIGEGKFGIVYKCENIQTKSIYAVKVINKKSYTKQSDHELIQREIGTLSIINHKNIIRLFDTFETDEQIYMVMEYIPGGDLFSHIAHHALFTEIEAYQLMYPIIDAVAYLHRMGIVHRDIKPENIFCVNDINDIKLGDFGLAQLVLPFEKLKKVYGTIAYMSPELLAGQGYTTKTDMWSIGVILYLIIQGDYPIRGNEKNEIIYNTIKETINFDYHNIKSKSKELQDLIRGLLTRDQNARYSAEQVLHHPWFKKMAKLCLMEKKEGTSSGPSTSTETQNNSTEQTETLNLFTFAGAAK